MQSISSSIKILMSRKQEQEHRELPWSTRSTNGPKPARHICYVCQRPRSSTYHSRHPPREPPPPQGVCRRCVREEKLEEHRQPPPAITIFEIHHYHHDCACKQEQPHASLPVKLPPPPAYLGCAELPAEDLRDRKGRSLSLDRLERAPPPVGIKPRLEQLRSFRIK
jgi:hypothetical protein